MSRPYPLVRYFPNLQTSSWRETSQQDLSYNCISWVMRDTEKVWDPDGFFWPPTVAREVSMDTITQICMMENFLLCEDGSSEVGYEKAAIYASDGMPTHIAVQKENGRWSSKVGEWEDIEHELTGLSGRRGLGIDVHLPYGNVVRFLKRRVQ